MTTVTVYDSPMCCATGVCGPEVDPALVQFAADLAWLKARGVEVSRVNLAQEPARFMQHAGVKALVERSGGDELPAILVGDELVASARYPLREELAAMVGIGSATSADGLSGQPSTATAACCGGERSTPKNASRCC